LSSTAPRAIWIYGEDFDVAMRMGAESMSRRDAIFVEHTNRAEAHVSRIDVRLVRERVAAVRATRFAYAVVRRPDGW